MRKEIKSQIDKINKTFDEKIRNTDSSNPNILKNKYYTKQFDTDDGQTGIMSRFSNKNISSTIDDFYNRNVK